PEGKTNEDLSSPSHGPGQLKVADIGARQDKDEAHGKEGQAERRQNTLRLRLIGRRRTGYDNSARIIVAGLRPAPVQQRQLRARICPGTVAPEAAGKADTTVCWRVQK